MAAYARLNLPRLVSERKESDVVIDGLYSWEQYIFLKNHYGEHFYVVAVWASPKIRYARLAARAERRLTLEEATGRDKAEMEKLNKSGPIAIADFTILNESSLKNLEREVKKTISALRRQD